VKDYLQDILVERLNTYLLGR